MTNLKNRDYVIIDGLNETTVFAVCPHCGEPFCIIGKPPSGSLANNEPEPRTVCFCRGADALSLAIMCCKVLKCNTNKDKPGCNLNPSTKGQEFKVQRWNTIVQEPLKE